MTDSDDTEEQFECEDCGETFKNTNQLNGHKASCDGGTDDETTDDDTDDTTMSNDTDDDVNSIKAELSAVMAGSAPLDNLHAQHEGGLDYSVLSARNGGATYHYVKLGDDPECTCEDYEFNRDGRDPCGHIVAAVFADRLDADEITSQAMLNHGHQMRSAAETLEDVGSMVEDAVVQLRSVGTHPDAEGGSSDSQTAESSVTVGSSPPSGPTAADKADELQAAFDDVVDDMQVQHSAGVVWFQTGQDTPDDWPFPGGDETFDVLTSPDAVKYVHDGSADWADSPHPLYDDKPGEWWKNALEPEDVDDYISEVLN